MRRDCLPFASVFTIDLETEWHGYDRCPALAQSVFEALARLPGYEVAGLGGSRRPKER